jgi:hypothetical protein
VSKKEGLALSLKAEVYVCSRMLTYAGVWWTQVSKEEGLALSLKARRLCLKNLPSDADLLQVC